MIVIGGWLCMPILIVTYTSNKDVNEDISHNQLCNVIQIKSWKLRLFKLSFSIKQLKKCRIFEFIC